MQTFSKDNLPDVPIADDEFQMIYDSYEGGAED